MACELIVEAHGLLRHDFIAADDHRAFERATLDEAFFQERFDIFVINKGARRSDFLLVLFGSDFAGEILGEASVGSDIGDGNFEGLAGDNRDQRAIGGFLMDCFADFPNAARRWLCDEACLANHFDEWS